MGDTAEAHIPVMADRVGALLAPALSGREAVVVDATLGLGGHSRLLLHAHPELRVVGIDRDADALRRARERLSGFADRLDTVHRPFDHLAEILDARGIRTVQGVLMDLGVSSPQLDEGERGFAYSYDAPLDMRMDRDQPLTAADVVNTYPVPRLTTVLREYGEERFARRIAESLARERERAPVDSTARLADIIREAVPAATRRSGGNPAKRTFQALRIEVNDELGLLRRTLPTAVDRLALHGRIAVLSYHSLEDRITKRTLAERATDTTPRGLPVALEEHRPELRLLTRGAETPSEAEYTENPRAASARLRAAERIREPHGGGET
jgi:16S rRNA (cytosine1402-N4)-methyltransferase